MPGRSPRDRSRSASRRSRRDRDRSSPRNRDRSGSRGRRNRRERSRGGRDDRSRSSSRGRDERRRSRGGRRGRDRSRSPRRSRRRRDNRSRSNSRDDRRRRRRRGRSQSSSRSPERRSRRRTRYSRSGRRSRRDRSYSPRYRSRSPYSSRRRRRDNDYTDSSSEYEDRRHRRRGGGHRRYRRSRRKERVFRLGDKVKIRLKNSYGPYPSYEKGEIDKVFDGMYGEKTYQVYIESRDGWERWVPAKDLQHWNMTQDEARATRDIYELRRQLKAGDRIANRRPNSFDDRDYRGGRRSRDRRDRRWDGSQAPSPQRGGTRGGGGQRAYPQSDVGPDNRDYHQTDAARATSVPPQNYTWPQFIADLTHAVYTRGDKDGPLDDGQGGGGGGGYDDEVDRRDKGADTMHVNAPEEIRSLNYGGRDKKEDDYDNPRDNYDDEDLDAREVNARIKDGDISEEHYVGTRDDRGRRGGAESYSATKGGGGRGPLIYIHCHQEPVSVRRDDGYGYEQGRTPGTRQ